MNHFTFAGRFLCDLPGRCPSYQPKLATSPVCISFHPKIMAMSCGQIDAADGFTLRRVPKNWPTGGVGVAEVHVGPAGCSFMLLHKWLLCAG